MRSAILSRVGTQGMLFGKPIGDPVREAIRVRAIYDDFGSTYSQRRRADPRLAAAIGTALDAALTVVDVGAGTGSYEPADRRVVAVEPSTVMLRQRAPGSAPAVRARAEALPFADGAFDAALAVLTIHHWADQRRGLEECARVSRSRVIVLTWDPASDSFWLVREYFPDLLAIDRDMFPALETFAAVLGRVETWPIPIPCDCMDGFLGAYWRRPEAYLDPVVRGGMSSFARISDVEEGVDRLRADLESGAWARRHGQLLRRTELDIGYRLIVSRT